MNSKIASLLDTFRNDARSVWLKEGEHQVDDVSNVLKRFFRDIEEGLFGPQSHNWLSTTGNTRTQTDSLSLLHGTVLYFVFVSVTWLQFYQTFSSGLIITYFMFLRLSHGPQSRFTGSWAGGCLFISLCLKSLFHSELNFNLQMFKKKKTLNQRIFYFIAVFNIFKLSFVCKSHCLLMHLNSYFDQTCVL